MFWEDLSVVVVTAAFASVSEVLTIFTMRTLLFAPCGRSRRAFEDALVGSRTPAMRTWFGLERYSRTSL
jgi:hypothetical protein